MAGIFLRFRSLSGTISHPVSEFMMKLAEQEKRIDDEIIAYFRPAPWQTNE
jgi:hypothetical protein